MTPRLANRRIRLVLALFALAFVLTFGRAVWLQVIRAPALERLAAQQHHETVTTPAGRGRGRAGSEHRPQQDLPAAAQQEAEIRLRAAPGEPRARGGTAAARSRRARLL